MPVAVAVAVLVVALVAGRALLGEGADSSSTGPSASAATTAPAASTTGRPGVALPGAATAAWVQAENALPGTEEWRLPGGLRSGDIEGFADQASVQRGEVAKLYVSTVARSFHVEAYRMGFYGGMGGRLLWTSGAVGGRRQAGPTVTAGTNMVEAPWQPSTEVPIDRTWPPGDYLFKLVGDGGQQAYVPLTVRDDASRAAYVIQNSVTTWQAYNNWGGFNLYEGSNGKGADHVSRSRIVSFDRPYRLGQGAADFLGLEYPLVALMESQGLDVTYMTNLDVHARPELLGNHRALLSLGHDEYWSTAMRSGVEAARDAGVNIAFFGANAVFRHVRIADSPVGRNRRVVDYKSATEDPVTATNPSEATVDFRAPPLKNPESTLIGNLYECNPVRADMVIVNARNWVFEGTGLRDGDHLADVVGSEYDRVTPGYPHPPNVELLTHSPLTCGKKATFADATYYTAASGAGVFASGTIDWIAKLDPSCTDCPGRTLDRITRNILAAFGAGPSGVRHPSTSNFEAVTGRPFKAAAAPTTPPATAG